MTIRMTLIAAALTAFCAHPALAQKRCDLSNHYDKAAANIVAETEPRYIAECRTTSIDCRQYPNGITFGPANAAKYGKRLLTFTHMACQIPSETLAGTGNYRRCGGEAASERIMTVAVARMAMTCRLCPPVEALGPLKGSSTRHLSGAELAALQACGF